MDKNKKKGPNDYLRKIDLLETKLVGEIDKGLTIDKTQEVIGCIDNMATEIEGLGVDMDSDEWIGVTLGLERLYELNAGLQDTLYNMCSLRRFLTNPIIDIDVI